jgi:hypothetical protein
MQALTLNRKKFVIPRFTPNISVLSYPKGITRGSSAEEILNAVIKVHKSNTYMVKNPLNELDLADIKESINNVLSNKGGWTELNNGIALSFVKDTDIRSEVHDAFEGRDTESYTYFSDSVYEEAFRNDPLILADVKKGQALHQCSESYIGDLLEKYDTKESKVYDKVIDAFVNQTSDKELVENEISWGDGTHGQFRNGGHKYYFYFRDY